MYFTCCKILGVHPSAHIDEIKRIYRLKAKRYHPDLNSSPYAHLEFIRIKNAFEYIVKYRQIYSLLSSNYSKRTNYSYYRTASPRYNDFYEKWKKTQRFNKRNSKSDFDFKTTVFGKTVYIFFHIIFLLAGICLLIQPSWYTIQNGFDPEKSLIGTLFAIVGVSSMGALMIILLSFSLLNIKMKISAANRR